MNPTDTDIDNFVRTVCMCRGEEGKGVFNVFCFLLIFPQLQSQAVGNPSDRFSGPSLLHSQHLRELEMETHQSSQIAQ